VHFAALPQELIAAYVATKEPLYGPALIRADAASLRLTHS